jgi:hypothetical protein
MLLGCGDKTKEPLALHKKLTTALEKEDYGFIFDSLTIESQKWALDFTSDVSEYTPEVAEIANTKSGRNLFVAVCEKGYVISDIFKAEKIRKIEVNGDEAIILVEGDPIPSMMIRENGDWKFKPKFHILNGMREDVSDSATESGEKSQNQPESQETVRSSAPSNGIKYELQALKSSHTKNIDLYNDAVGRLALNNLFMTTQEVQQFRANSIGEICEAELFVGDIFQRQDYHVVTMPVLDSGKNVIINLYALTDEDFDKISNLTIGSSLKIKGIFKNLTNDFIEIGPAILIDELSEELIKLQNARSQEQATMEKLKNLPVAKASGIKSISGEFYDIFLNVKRSPYSKEDFQKELARTGVLGEVIEWTLKVVDTKKEKNTFKIVTMDDFKVNTLITLRPASETERLTAESLRKGDIINVKGYAKSGVYDSGVYIEGGEIRFLNLDPAIVVGIENKDLTRNKLTQQIELLKNSKPSKIRRDGEIYEFYKKWGQDIPIAPLYKMAGEIVEWSLPVESIKIYSDHCKITTTGPKPNRYMEDKWDDWGYTQTTIDLYPGSEEQMKAFDEAIKPLAPGSYVRIRGLIEGFAFNHCKISPAIMIGTQRNEELVEEILDIVRVTPSDIQRDDAQLQKLLNPKYVFEEDERKKIAAQYIGKVIEWDCDVLTRDNFIENIGMQNNISTASFDKNQSFKALIYYLKAESGLNYDSFKKRTIKGKIKSLDNGVWIEPAILVDEHYRSLRQNLSFEASRPKIGIYMSDDTRDGVLVTEVVDGSAAQFAGLQANDIIHSIDGKPMKDISSVIAAISSHGPGESVEVRFIRGADTIVRSIKLDPIGTQPKKVEERDQEKKLIKEESGETDTDQGRVVESFVTTITNNDIRNSNGVQILDPVLILMQDRANVHRFGNPDGDNVDQFFKLAGNRAKIRSFLERGSFPQDIQQSILSGNGVKLKIRVYSNDEGKNCVDVSYEGAQGDATSDFLPDQKIMAFIDSVSNFRMEPSVNSAVKFQPRKGTTGLVLERRDKWVKIELENGDIGWVFETNLKSVD